MKITPIETHYQGILFRSRTEARWAVFFDHLEIKWEYEKEGYEISVDGKATWYLPDFWLPQFSSFVEIKGDKPTDAELKKAKAIRDDIGKAIFVFYGIPTELIEKRKADGVCKCCGGELQHIYISNPGFGFLWDISDGSGGSCDAELCKFVYEHKRSVASIAVMDFQNRDRSLFINDRWEGNDRVIVPYDGMFDEFSLSIYNAVNAAKSERFGR